MQRLLPTTGGVDTSGLIVEGLFVFIQYLFDHFNFEKVYLEVPEYNMSLFSGGAGSLLVQEGRLTNHYFYGERSWDCFILALHRSNWDAIVDGLRGEWPAHHFEPHPDL